MWVGRRRAVRVAAPPPFASRDVVTLALDLRARGARRRAEQLLAAWARAADDYGIYRSIDLAIRPAPPVVIATGGGIATGKSTLAKTLSRRMAAPVVVADRVRDALLAPLGEAVAHEIGWTPGFVERIYGAVFDRADAVVASGRSVVIDSCFPRLAQRRAAAALAERHGARFVFVHCDPAPAEIEARLARREARDGGEWRALAAAAAEWEPLRADEPGRHLRLASDRAWRRALEERT